MKFAEHTAHAIPIHVVETAGLDAFLNALAPEARAWVEACGFRGALGSHIVLPGAASEIGGVVIGLGSPADRARSRFGALKCQPQLPAGTYSLATELAPELANEFATGWLLSQYRFDRYKSKAANAATLIAPEGVDAARIEAQASGEFLIRDLINTPASDMGPAELEAAAKTLARDHGATFTSVIGSDLIDSNFPMIHAVGRAAQQQPRLIEMRWGDTGPALTLVGKGVCFDTGGLNIKPGASMGLMKKDMGGAATVLGLAHMIMALNLPLRLRVLIPAVENSIDARAFRPQDILTSRKGLTVEINNTDAEGRLVLADALALADEEPPDLLISMATLTGAARVAVGADLAPFYATDDAQADALIAAGARVRDPLWRMPFWDPYEAMIEPGVADLDNAPKGGFGGSITAALFLRRFVEASPNYLHFDIYGWQPTAAPARPKGGVGQGARAILDALPKLLNL